MGRNVNALETHVVSNRPHRLPVHSLMPDAHPPAPQPFELLLQRGQALENDGRFDEALSAYDHALALLRVAGNSADPATRRALGLAWMNRANALQRIATAPSLAAAIASYDEAIVTLRLLPLETEPLNRNHLGAAWLNRGHAHIVSGNHPAAAESFIAAVRELEQLPLEKDPYFRLNLAGAHTNLAHALLSAREQNQLTAPDTATRAADAARAALHVLAEVERTHEAFAGLALRARRALVIALHALLTEAEAARQPIAELASAATDAVDDGLALARDLELHGLSHHRPLAYRLFRMGVQLYGIHQPHFLAEFVLETLATPAFAADAEFRAISDEALQQTLATLQRAPVRPDAASDRALETAQSLRAAQRQLAALPPFSPPPSSPSS